MKRLLNVLLLLAYSVAIAWITNPSEAKHQSAVFDRVDTALHNHYKAEHHIGSFASPNGPDLTVDSIFLSISANKLVCQQIYRKNFYILSFTKCHSPHSEQHPTIGIGVLGRVFLSATQLNSLEQSIK